MKSANTRDLERLTAISEQLARTTRSDAKKRLWKLAGWYVFAGAISLLIIVPFLWMLSNSLLETRDVGKFPPTFWPSDPQWSNFVTAFNDIGLGRALINSTVVAGVTTITVLIFDSLAGYAFAKLRFPGRGAMFMLTLVTVMIPVQVTMIPLFIMFRHAPLIGGNDIAGNGGQGLINTFGALTLPFLVTTFGTYLMREMFRQVPTSLLEAARIDGQSEWGIFWKVYLPLVKPGLAAIGIFNFTFVWNDFLIPLVMGTQREMYTAQVALSAYKDQYFTDWNMLMAGTAIACIPPFIVFLVGQRYFVKGLAMQGVRG